MSTSDFALWIGGFGQFSDGVRAFTRPLRTRPTPAQIVYAHSSGGVVAAQWLEEHGDDYDASSNGPLSFVLIGDPTRAYGGANVPWAGAWPKPITR